MAPEKVIMKEGKVCDNRHRVAAMGSARIAAAL